MGGAADPTVQRLLLDLEIHIHAVEDFRTHVFKQVVRHLDILVSSGVIFKCFLADLDAGRIERHITVLIRTDKQ